jgi:hypothetical protein
MLVDDEVCFGYIHQCCLGLSSYKGNSHSRRTCCRHRATGERSISRSICSS